MRDKVENISTIKIYNISLMLTADNRSQEVEKCHQIGNWRFSSGEAMPICIKFSIMYNMIMNNGLEQFRVIVENRNVSVIAHSGVITSFK
jgi:hypothetical protein